MLATADFELGKAEQGDLSAGIPHIRKVGQRFSSEWAKELAVGPVGALQRKMKGPLSVPEDALQRGRDCVEQHTAALQAFRELGKSTELWTALNVVMKISELRSALSHAESCRDAFCSVFVLPNSDVQGEPEPEQEREAGSDQREHRAVAGVRGGTAPSGLAEPRARLVAPPGQQRQGSRLLALSPCSESGRPRRMGSSSVVAHGRRR